MELSRKMMEDLKKFSLLFDAKVKLEKMTKSKSENTFIATKKPL